MGILINMINIIKIKLAGCYFERSDYKNALKIWSEEKNNKSLFFFRKVINKKRTRGQRVKTNRL